MGVDPLAADGEGDMLAMALPPEMPPSGAMPAGKTKPSEFLFPTREHVGGAAPMRRVPLKTTESGRSMQTKPLTMGKEGAVLEAGAENLARGPTAQDWLKLQKIIEQNSVPGDQLHTVFSKLYDAVRSGVPFRQAMLQHGSEDMLEAMEKVLQKDRSQFGLGWPEDLPFQNE